MTVRERVEAALSNWTETLTVIGIEPKGAFNPELDRKIARQALERSPVDVLVAIVEESEQAFRNCADHFNGYIERSTAEVDALRRDLETARARIVMLEARE